MKRCSKAYDRWLEKEYVPNILKLWLFCFLLSFFTLYPLYSIKFQIYHEDHRQKLEGYVPWNLDPD